MNGIDIEFDKSNIIKRLESESFFKSWDVFFRELLSNALDACNLRAALELSWGKEFLEIEKSSELDMFREIYEPRITITYNSDSRMFSIEDNGIGINEYDLNHFVTKIGESYYTSEDFFVQKLDFSPISRHGMGLLSCYAAGRAILIESQKDDVINTAWNVKNPQETASIMAKWFEGKNKLEYVTSKKKPSGTKITVPIKPEYASYIDMSFIVDHIAQYTMYQPIPITINCDGEKRRIYHPKVYWRYPHTEMVGMHVIEVDTDLLEGYIVLFHDSHRQYFQQCELFQQNIKVTDYPQALMLTPRWIDNISYCLNIKSGFLNKQLSHDMPVFDEKLDELRLRVGQVLIDYFGQAPMTLSQYITGAHKQISCPYEAENELVARAVQVTVFLKGRIVDVPIRTVIKGFAGKRVKIASIHRKLFERYKRDYPYDFGQFDSSFDMIVFEAQIDIFWQFVAPYVERMEYVISENPGIIYTSASVNFSEKKNKAESRYDDEKDIDHTWAKDAPLIVAAADIRPQFMDIDQVFCLVSNEQTNPMEIVINPGNKNAGLLLRTSENKKIRRILSVIIENIKQRILKKQKTWHGIVDFGGELALNYTLDEPMSMQAVWALERDFADEINTFIAKTLTPEEIMSLGLASLYFTKDDFIEWWIAP